LRHWKAGPGSKVAVVGLGGLGHMAVKIAHALGAEVTVLSQTLGKEAEGRRLGADHYHEASDPETLRAQRGSSDLIINTVSAKLPLDSYLGLLRRDGFAADVEVIGVDQVDEADERVLRSDVRFRFVIDIATLTTA
jgi:uncharacterized zinc-type alcohol dehydrogenase-like protein